VGEGALKIGRRRQQSRQFFVMVGVVEMEIFWLMVDGSVEARRPAHFLRSKRWTLVNWVNLNKNIKVNM
jgi:hypothetical protein